MIWLSLSTCWEIVRALSLVWLPFCVLGLSPHSCKNTATLLVGFPSKSNTTTHACPLVQPYSLMTVATYFTHIISCIPHSKLDAMEPSPVINWGLLVLRKHEKYPQRGKDRDRAPAVWFGLGFQLFPSQTSQFSCRWC